MKCNNIILVSYMDDPIKSGTSTQIMVKNLLFGLKQIAENLTFVAIVDPKANRENIKNYYKNFADDICICESYLNFSDTKGKYSQLIKNFKAVYNSAFYKKSAKDLENTPCDILIAHAPSFESIMFAAELLKLRPSLRYIQYWSDPYALSGIIPKNMGIKRLPFKILEKYLISKADDIVYGTKTLMDGQKLIYPKLADKMRFCDVSYGDENVDCDVKNDLPVFGYLGNYYMFVRNITPLLEAFSDINQAKLLVCGSGDVEIKNTKSIENLGRVPQNDINNIEKTVDVSVCLLNSTCLQIPGKIFYNTNSKKKILVILDGEFKESIHSYLKEFDRFEFCENTKESIKEAVIKICKSPIFDGTISPRLSPQNVCRDIISKN